MERDKLGRFVKGHKVPKKCIDVLIKNNHKSKRSLGMKHTEEAKIKIGIASKGNQYAKGNKPNKTSFTKGSMLGEKNVNWQGGKSFELYGKEFDKELKKEIKMRDNNECILCKIEHEKKKEEIAGIIFWQRAVLLSKFEVSMNKKLSIHHIDYNKKNNDRNNLITLCGSHHVRTNGNREYWTKFFQSLLSKKYIKIQEAITL